MASSPWISATRWLSNPFDKFLAPFGFLSFCQEGKKKGGYLKTDFFGAEENRSSVLGPVNLKKGK